MAAKQERWVPSGMIADLMLPSKSAVQRAADNLARVLGYADADDPKFRASTCCGGSTPEPYELNADDRALLRDLDNARALRSYDALAERGER